MKKTRIFPKELFDALAEEAIEDLKQTGMSHEEMTRVLRDVLGPDMVRRYLDGLDR